MCNCGKKTTGNVTYKVKLPGGQIKTYSSEIEAMAEAQRTGGTVTKA